MGVLCPDRMLELDFSSVQFIFVFLPLTLFVYYLLPKACRNGVLAMFSLLFFALAGYRSAAVVLGTAFINWLGGLLLERAQRKKPLLVLLVGCNAAILAVMKYAPLLVETLNPLLGGSLPMVSAVLPVGMSFYLFTAIGYCADIAAGKAAAIKSPVRFFVFLAFFGHSLSGPIVRWEQQAPQLPCRSENRRVDADRFCAGIKRFVLGLSKKVLLADQLALICAKVTSVPAATLPAPILLLGYTAYMLQFYCEISGYADMAVGLGHFFGITLPESFDDPYCAKSVTDFWHRWNIPLSDWFRDYVYIPLGGSRKGEGRACLNLLLVFALTGFWHGAAWKYLVFGAMHGVILCAERLGLRRWVERLPGALQHGYTLAMLWLTFVVYGAPGMREALAALRGVLTWQKGAPGYEWQAFADTKLLLIFVAALLLCGILQSLLPRLKRAARDQSVPSVPGMIVLVGLLFLCIMRVSVGTYNEFLYIRF